MNMMRREPPQRLLHMLPYSIPRIAMQLAAEVAPVLVVSDSMLVLASHMAYMHNLRVLPKILENLAGS